MAILLPGFEEQTEKTLFFYRKIMTRKTAKEQHRAQHRNEKKRQKHQEAEKWWQGTKNKDK